MRNATLKDVIQFGIKACQEHGFSFIGIYKTRSEKFVNDGWDRYIISPVHVPEKEYQFVGIVRKDGTSDIRECFRHSGDEPIIAS